jgi:hypothetical protein
LRDFVGTLPHPVDCLVGYVGTTTQVDEGQCLQSREVLSTLFVRGSWALLNALLRSLLHSLGVCGAMYVSACNCLPVQVAPLGKEQQRVDNHRGCLIHQQCGSPCFHRAPEQTRSSGTVLRRISFLQPHLACFVSCQSPMDPVSMWRPVKGRLPQLPKHDRKVWLRVCGC